MLILNQTQAKELSGSYQSGVEILIEWGNIYAEAFLDGSIFIRCGVRAEEVYASIDEFRNAYAFYL